MPRSRRAELGDIALGAASAGGLALATYTMASTTELYAAAPSMVTADPAQWLAGLEGEHRVVIDAYRVNDGFPLAYAHEFLSTGGSSAVVVLRALAVPLALDHGIWERYRIGEALKITDPATGRPAARNPYLCPPSNVLLIDDMAIDRLLGRGVIFGACALALALLSGKLAGNAGVSADIARAGWASAIVPGVAVIPSGVWGVNRAQESGCRYCAGG